MKKFVKQLTALALALAVGTMGQTARASWALGTELVGRTAELAEGVSLTSQSLWSASKSDLRTENYITYIPGNGVVPMVYSGKYVASRNTVAAAAADLEEQGCRVVAGINGGFFNSDGTIVGMLMTEGVVRSLDVENHILLGFTRDGQVFIDESKVTKTVSWETEDDDAALYDLAGFNAYRSNYNLGGLYLYNQDFSSRVSLDTSRGCVAVVLSSVFGDEEGTGDGTQPSEGEGEGTGDGTQPSEGEGEGTGDGTQPSEGEGGGTGDGSQPSEGEGEGTGDGTKPSEGENAGTGDGTQPSKGENAGTGDGTQPSEGEGAGTGDGTQLPEPVIMNGTLTLSVEKVMDTRASDAFDAVLSGGRYMLYANYYNGNNGLLDALRSLMPGQQVSVTVGGVSEQWADAAYGISGLYTLLRNGEIVSGLPTPANPYTAVGIRADGTAVFYTIDGRQSGYSVGATYAQVAQRLQELGCVTAVALDGGGSTTLGATLPGRQRFEVVNQPSEDSRRLNNSIFLVLGDGYAGMDPGFYLSSDTQVVLTGASLDVSAVGYDRWGKAVSGTASDDESESGPDEAGMTPDWSATGGTIEGNGLTAVYTAGNIAGTYTISAGSGSELPVRVVDGISSLWVTREGSSAKVDSLKLLPGDTVDLSVSGIWWNLPATVNGANVIWEADASIGTVGASGAFTAAGADEALSGRVTASVGGLTAAVQLTVQAYPFSDINGHWSAPYVTRLHTLGLTNGRGLEEGIVVYEPNAEMTRGELIAFITRLLQVDTDEYQDVELPFEDAGDIAGWLLPDVKAMYALCVLNGSDSGGKLYANVGSNISREEAMTLLGRVLADEMSQDLSGFADSDLVSGWARPYVETLVGLNVVSGSDGMLTPQSNITRGEIAKLLVEIYGLEKAELAPRETDSGNDEQGTQEPDGSDGQTDGFGEDTGDSA